MDYYLLPTLKDFKIRKALLQCYENKKAIEITLADSEPVKGIVIDHRDESNVKFQTEKSSTYLDSPVKICIQRENDSLWIDCNKIIRFHEI